MTRIKVAILNDYDVVIAGLAAMLRPYRSQIAVIDVSTGPPDPPLPGRRRRSTTPTAGPGST